MASQVLGLFTSPQQYQQQQQDLARSRAMEFARLNPFEQATAAIGQGSYNLAGAIGGALGGQDPQLQIISRRQALASKLDPSNPQSYMEAAKLAADAGDQQFAITIADAGREASVKVAQANKERQLAVPADIHLRLHNKFQILKPCCQLLFLDQQKKLQQTLRKLVLQKELVRLFILT
jgi:hypothetical protein